MESFGASYSESLISSLNYTLGRTSSAIQDRREVKIKPRGATSYSPQTAKTIEFTVTDSAAYLLLNTVKLQFKLRNDGAAGQDLEMLGPAHAVPFQSMSLKIAGQQVEFIEQYGKSYIAMDSLLPQASSVMNGEEGLPLIYDKNAIQKYWEGQGSALQQRWCLDHYPHCSEPVCV